MKKVFEDVRKAAICWGCPFKTQIAGQDTMLCMEFAEGDPKIFPPVDMVEGCERRDSEVVMQLKMEEPKLGIGFIMTPLEGEDEGDCKVQLVGVEGILFTGKLSELFPNETFVALTTVRLFDETGKDHTGLILKKALAHAYDATPQSKHIFGGLKSVDPSGKI